MCRLLVVKKVMKFDITKQLKIFANICKNSREFQGHGWGISYLNDKNEWVHYRNIKPIWEDDLSQFTETKFLMCHARSAFQDKGIVVENNMPFYDDKFVFIFNGELQGVRIKEAGRIGAEKIFNFIRKNINENITYGIITAISRIKKRTRYIRGMNIIMATKDKLYLNSHFGEDPGYFSMHIKNVGNDITICSRPYPGESDWRSLPNNILKIFE